MAEQLPVESGGGAQRVISWMVQKIALKKSRIALATMWLVCASPILHAAVSPKEKDMRREANSM